MTLLPIAVLLGAFLFWMGMVARVRKEFKGAPDLRTPLTLTFYTFGIAGLLMLLGRKGKSGDLRHWVQGLTGARAGPKEVAKPDGKAKGITIQLARSDGTPVGRDAAGQGALVAVRTVLQQAIEEQATDVHVEPEPGQLKIRCRVDGMLQARGSYPPEMALTVVSALKVMAGMDVAERRRAQDGSFSASFQGRSIDFRASSVGTARGENMVIRILDKTAGLRQLQSLGLSRKMYDQLKSIVRSPHGMLVVCGPTGSGKTTTLYAALQEVDRCSLNVITIENPIEYHLENVSQHSINEKAGITFAGLLRTMLRQDPDILMVGEIRDKETAEIGMQAAMTGHFVYTTVHANDTVSAVFRLINLGTPSYLIATSVTAILAQRLVRRLCPACRRRRPPTVEELKQFASAAIGRDKVSFLHEAQGCSQCHETGYRGRVGVFELLVFNDDIQGLVQGTPSVTELKRAADLTGLVRLRQDALAKASQGVTSVEEALRVTG